MCKNYYISNMSVINLNIMFRLLENGWVSENQYNINHSKFIRYIANIRYMLDEYHITYIWIEYDSINKRYILHKN